MKHGKRKGIGVTLVGASGRGNLPFDYLQRHPAEGYIAGIYDTIPERGEFVKRKFNGPDVTIFKSLGAAVSDPRTDAVFIGTPDYAHTAPALAALKAGKHVFCEKPLATTQADLDAVCHAAEKSDRIFYLGMNLRHSPVHAKMHELVQAGRIGRLVMIEANEYYYGGRTLFRRWNRLRRNSGGMWITKACHDFDVLNWFTGGNPVRVYATCSLSHYKPNPKAGPNCRDCRITQSCPDYYDVANDPHKYWELMEITDRTYGFPHDICLYNSDKDTFDNGMAIVDYDNDIRGSFAMTVVSSRENRQMRLTGTDGALEGDLETGTVTHWQRHTFKKTVLDVRQLMESGHHGADEGIMADFFRCCRTGAKPRSNYLDGRRSVMVGLAATKSSDTGRPVAIDVSLNAI